MSKPKKYKIFMVLAEDCPPCENFHKSHYSKIEKVFGKDKINLIIIKRKAFYQNPKNRIVMREKIIQSQAAHAHPQVYNYSWTPTIGLVTAESWDNKEGLLEGVVYAGRMSTMIDRDMGGVHINKFSLDKNRPPLNSNSVINWVNQQLENNIIFQDKVNVIVEENPNMRMLGQEGTIRIRHRPINLEW